MYFYLSLQKIHIGTVLVFLHLASGQPQGFGDNFLSANFDTSENFDSSSAFIPEFNFDGFFRKVDAPPLKRKGKPSRNQNGTWNHDS
jgi:hypothetical protein